MPILGLGTWPLREQEAETAVVSALELGYRHIDTAARYENEAAVGRGIAASGVDRGEMFIVTKLRGSDQGRAATKDGLRASLDRLGLDYVDLFLIHWPLPRLDLFVESYESMIELAQEGLVRNLGVSNFQAHHLDRLIAETGQTPLVNQIQLTPNHPRTDLRAYLATLGILVEGWRPFGTDSRLLTDPVVAEIAATHGRTPAQVVLRWNVQQDIVVIPKSSDPARQRSNMDIFDFALSEAEMARMGGLEISEDYAMNSDEHEEF